MLDQGNLLFRNNSLTESSTKYKTGLRKLPREVEEDWEETFEQLRTLFLLNLSRCERRQGHYSEAASLASSAIQSNPHSVDALIARAKAYKAQGHLGEALKDYSSASCLVPNNKGIYLSFLKLRDEMKAKTDSKKTALYLGSANSLAYIDDTSTNCSSI